MDLDTYIALLKERNRNIPKAVDKIVKRIGGVYILKPLKLRLFNQGTDGDGTLIGGGTYTPGYAARKKRKGVRSSPVTLRLTGKWYKSFRVDSSFGSIEVNAYDETPNKTDQLFKKYGNKILNLTPEEEKKLAEKISEELKDEFDIGDINFKFE